jgi:hypothetical protein
LIRKAASAGQLYLVCEGNHTQQSGVLEIDKDSLARKKRWDLGEYPDGIGFGERRLEARIARQHERCRRAY